MSHRQLPFGLNGTASVRANLDSGLIAARDAGFSFHEPRLPALVDCKTCGSRERTLAVLQEADLSLLALSALEGVFELANDRLLARAEVIFSRAERFNVRQAIAVPGRGHTSLADARELLVELSKRGREDGVSPSYEFIGFPEHAFPSSEAAHAVAGTAGLPLVLDTFHLAVSHTDPEGIATLPPDAIALVRLSDALAEGKAMEKIADSDRVLPGGRGAATCRLCEGDLERGIRRSAFGGGPLFQARTGGAGNSRKAGVSAGK